MVPITTIVYLFITTLIFLADPSAFQDSSVYTRATIPRSGFGLVHPGY
ncbi:hypothetical protein vseg_014102 [Gypsophila vaccaria]